MKQFLVVFSGVLALFSLRAESADPLAQKFQNLLEEARTWVYCFWNSGNVTSEGITADLETMQRVGIGGVLIMGVATKFAPPRCTAEFMNPEWLNLFQFAVQEAARLGLEIQVANLWPSRMIGDAALPAEKRLTWSSWEPLSRTHRCCRRDFSDQSEFSPNELMAKSGFEIHHG